MKFRFYIANALVGEVVGTNDEKIAKEFADDDENVVLDTETGEWMMDRTNRTSIPEQTDYQFS